MSLFGLTRKRRIRQTSGAIKTRPGAGPRTGPASKVTETASIQPRRSNREPTVSVRSTRRGSQSSKPAARHVLVMAGMVVARSTRRGSPAQGRRRLNWRPCVKAWYRPVASDPTNTTCPHDCYINQDGKSVHPPARDHNGQPLGATALCRDGTFSFSQHTTGTCSHHDAERVPRPSGRSQPWTSPSLEVTPRRSRSYAPALHVDLNDKKPALRNRVLMEGGASDADISTARAGVHCRTTPSLDPDPRARS
jgi:hypothetical protein